MKSDPVNILVADIVKHEIVESNNYVVSGGARVARLVTFALAAGLHNRMLASSL